MLENMEGLMKEENQEKLARQHTRDKTNKCQRIPKGSTKDNPEELATQDTQKTRQINVREYGRGNEKGQSRKKLAKQDIQETRQIRTIQRNWQHKFI